MIGCYQIFIREALIYTVETQNRIAKHQIVMNLTDGGYKMK